MEVTKPKVEIISHTQCPYDVISVAAKTCYSSMDLDDLMRKFTDAERLKLIKSLEDSKHESPFEHVSITFAISNISRACSHQLVRHRIASFSQRSQRYVDETGFNYFVPVNINSSKNIKEYYTHFMNKVGVIYEELKDAPFPGINYLKKKYEGLDLDLSKIYRKIVNYQVKKYGESFTSKKYWMSYSGRKRG